MCRCQPEALQTAGGALAAASYELGCPGLPSSPKQDLARSPFDVVLDSCHRSFSGFGGNAGSASNALVDLEALTSQRSIASSKVTVASTTIWPAAMTGVLNTSLQGNTEMAHCLQSLT